jgi:hypothetical protein
VSDAFDERLARTQETVEQRVAATEQTRSNREELARQERAAATNAARALLPELHASIEALRRFEEAGPDSTSRWKITRKTVDLGGYPDSAPISLTREYRTVRGFGKGSSIDGWTIVAARGGLTIKIPRAAGAPLVVHPPASLEAAANAGIYSASGRVVIVNEAFDSVIQMIADHIARGHSAA